MDEGMVMEALESRTEWIGSEAELADVALVDFSAMVKQVCPALLSHPCAGVRGDWAQRVADHRAAVGVGVDLKARVVSLQYLDISAADIREFTCALRDLTTPTAELELLEAAGRLAAVVLNAFPEHTRLALAQTLRHPEIDIRLSAHKGVDATVFELCLRAPDCTVLVGRIVQSERASDAIRH